LSSRILVADDSQAVRDILQMSLETLGYSVVLAEDGERAMECIKSDHPDLIIADVMMPKVNGFQICRRVKSDPSTHRTPVILLTARSGTEDVFWGKDCGADEYITKPFRTQDLEQSIDRLLKRAGSPPSREPQDVHRTQPLQRGGQIVMLRWDPRALDVFRKKYGEIKFSEAMRALGTAAQEFMGRQGETGPVAVHVQVGLSAVIRREAPRAIELGKALASHLNGVALSFYGAEDRAQGHIRFRDPRTGLEAHLPLLSFAAAIDPDTHV
jgi:DNA-binding response OmpR family regulator